MKLEHQRTTLVIASMIVLLSACGGTPKKDTSTPDSDVPYTVTEDYSSGIISYTVQRGDRLGDIAKEFTGDARNWRQIADFNSISNPRKLKEGDVLNIPTDLIPGYERPTPPPTTKIETKQPVQTAQTGSLAVRRNEPVEVAPVVVTPINANRDFELNPIDESSISDSRSFDGTGTKIKVNGSYYPKGIYTEPAAYSKLIMRVAPGTFFSLDSQINDWYKIETDRGVGYIRTSDADIIN